MSPDELDALTMPFLAAMSLLVVAGVAKARSPLEARAAARILVGERASAAAVWILAVSEVAVGAAGLVAGAHAVVAGCAAALYLTFAVAVVELRRRGHTSISCGCFGRASQPVGRGHIAVNLLLAAMLAGAAVRGADGVPSAVLSGAGGLTVVLGAAAATWALLAMLTHVPALERRRGLRPERTEPGEPKQFTLSITTAARAAER